MADEAFSNCVIGADQVVNFSHLDALHDHLGFVDGSERECIQKAAKAAAEVMPGLAIVAEQSHAESVCLVIYELDDSGLHVKVADHVVVIVAWLSHELTLCIVNLNIGKRVSAYETGDFELLDHGNVLARVFLHFPRADLLLIHD